MCLALHFELPVLQVQQHFHCEGVWFAPWSYKLLVEGQKPMVCYASFCLPFTVARFHRGPTTLEVVRSSKSTEIGDRETCWQQTNALAGVESPDADSEHVQKCHLCICLFKSQWRAIRLLGNFKNLSKRDNQWEFHRVCNSRLCRDSSPHPVMAYCFLWIPTTFRMHRNVLGLPE